MQYAKA